MRVIMLGIMAFAIASCSSAKDVQRRASTQTTEKSAAETPVETDKPTPPTEPGRKPEPKSDGSVDLELVKHAPTGVQQRLVSSQGLDRLYARVFLRRANGFYGAPCNAFNHLDCKNTFFTDAEAKDMSDLILTRGVDEFRNPSAITLNYLRALRVMLDRECRFMVQTELNRIVANPSAPNVHFATVLGTPPVENLDRLLRRILGIDGLPVALDSGAAAYRTAFEQAIASAPPEQQTLRKTIEDTYIATCIAIAMDPRVIVY